MLGWCKFINNIVGQTIKNNKSDIAKFKQKYSVGVFLLVGRTKMTDKFANIPIAEMTGHIIVKIVKIII